MNVDKLEIQNGTKELLEKAEMPKEFITGLQELLKSFDRTYSYFIFQPPSTSHQTRRDLIAFLLVKYLLTFGFKLLMQG